MRGIKCSNKDCDTTIISSDGTDEELYMAGEKFPRKPMYCWACSPGFFEDSELIVESSSDDEEKK